MLIRRLRVEELPETMELVLRVFMEFEAPEYSQEGVEEFKRFIAVEAMEPPLRSGERPVWCCVEDGKIVGMIALRDKSHVCLLFVDKAYQRRGIARALFEAASQGLATMTVFSSPYAVEAYRHLGFVPTDTEQTVNGLRFTPMRYERATAV
ncbi:Ribosomal protein S18 acetylase RimI [Acetanaerobacterium elongatum]|uniref:Ribosomal protein S18 acetylase RimI n=1 Tax=Acetanaerobacterium elongatum TaxID=258515 RepID=A0A1H0H6P4_9FIRM|nr:Ribosomal protein S18 acetylase RimI [Acetanaerobacterium elongatum]